ncbi:MAG: polysaccharide deacetylase family protein [Lachnospiraceae bacterium]|nr:polysaccharide deacetylase family protein [Lachnospiraceae bacterium]
MECGIIWATALIVAVGGLLFTEATLKASGPDGSVIANAIPGESDYQSGVSGQPGSNTDNGNTQGLTGDSATYDNQVGDRQLPIYCVNTDKKVVALSFDAAWGNEDTMILMDILAKYNVKVTFFMTGGWVNKFPEDVKYIAEQGHDLGNHSLSHKEMSKLSEAEIREELQAVHDKVKELTGIEMDLFRPPYGDYDDEVITTARDMGYFTIQWDVDSLDWKDYGAASIVKTVCNHKNLKNGSIILMHNGAKYTPEALESVIKGLLDQGYEIVPISELIIRDSYHLDHTGMQIAD